MHLFHAGQQLVVWLVTLDCTGGLLTRYLTADSVVDMGSTSASAE